MGRTKSIQGDNHIVFHVGKELLPDRESIILSPGTQTAQGWGVYFSEQPQLKYTGGEHFHKKLDISPIFCVPLTGVWRTGQPKKSNTPVYHTEGRLVLMKNMRTVDSTIDGQPVRYYVPEGVTFLSVPNSPLFRSELIRPVLLGEQMPIDETLQKLAPYPQETIDPSVYSAELRKSVFTGRLPKLDFLEEESHVEIQQSLRLGEPLL